MWLVSWHNLHNWPRLPSCNSSECSLQTLSFPDDCSGSCGSRRSSELHLLAWGSIPLSPCNQGYGTLLLSALQRSNVSSWLSSTLLPHLTYICCFACLLLSREQSTINCELSRLQTMWWFICIVSVLERLRQEDSCKCDASLGYIGTLSL